MRRYGLGTPPPFAIHRSRSDFSTRHLPPKLKLGMSPMPGESIGSGVVAMKVFGEVLERHHRRFGARA